MSNLDTSQPTTNHVFLECEATDGRLEDAIAQCDGGARALGGVRAAGSWNFRFEAVLPDRSIRALLMFLRLPRPQFEPVLCPRHWLNPFPSKTVSMTLHTPDGRYIVVRGRLWRATNPKLSDQAREQLVKALMEARRGVRSTDPGQKAEARRAVNQAKRRLGERGPVWWDDAAPDYNRHMAKNTPYAAWFASLNLTAPTSATQKLNR